MPMLSTLELHPAEPATASLIVLHGLGADGSDFVPFCGELTLEEAGPVRFVLPSAPVRRVSINNGYPMQAWYDILPVNGPRREDEASLREAHTQVMWLIEREIARGVPAHRIVLAGFSQGCAMTLLAGLRHPQRLAGLAGLSGYLPLAATTAAERSAVNADLPVFLAHGQNDEVVVPARGEAARDALLALGQPVDWHTWPMGHAVCQPEIDALQAWLDRVLAV